MTLTMRCGKAYGPTYEQTVLNIKDAIEFHIEGLVAESLPLPEPYYHKDEVTEPVAAN